MQGGFQFVQLLKIGNSLFKVFDLIVNYFDEKIWVQLCNNKPDVKF